MRYRSTRGLFQGYTFEEVLLKGYAEDGGLILPSEIPRISTEVLTKWQHHSYIDIVYEIAKLYIDSSEIPYNILYGILSKAYAKFKYPELVKFSTLKDGVTIAELYHGPTMAFKDLAMSVFAQLLNYFLNKHNKQAIALVATSGDTGSAAIVSMAGLNKIDLIVMFPRHRCTELQQLQMTTVIDPNIHCYSVDGTSDEEDVVMTKILNDIEFSKKHNVTVANSINWARILVQTATYFYIYLRNVQRVGDLLSVVVPSGGAGNLIAGCIAHQMSLPIRIVATVNTNDVLHRFLKNGRLEAAKDVVKTWASAMDIQIPPNLERIILLFSGDEKLAHRSMMDFYQNHSVVIPENIMKKIRSAVVDSFSVSDTVIVETIKKCWEENNGYLICPHTATALAYVYNQNQQLENKNHNKVVCVATASPIKFSEAITATKIPMQDTYLQQLRKLPYRFKPLERNDNWEEILRTDICKISAAH